MQDWQRIRAQAQSTLAGRSIANDSLTCLSPYTHAELHAGSQLLEVAAGEGLVLDSNAARRIAEVELAFRNSTLRSIALLAKDHEKLPGNAFDFRTAEYSYGDVVILSVSGGGACQIIAALADARVGDALSLVQCVPGTLMLRDRWECTESERAWLMDSGHLAMGHLGVDAWSLMRQNVATETLQETETSETNPVWTSLDVSPGSIFQYTHCNRQCLHTVTVLSVREGCASDALLFSKQMIEQSTKVPLHNESNPKRNTRRASALRAILRANGRKSGISDTASNRQWNIKYVTSNAVTLLLQTCNKRRCDLCSQAFARWVVCGSPVARVDPCFECAVCFRARHSTDTSAFKCYPYAFTPL